MLFDAPALDAVFSVFVPDSFVEALLVSLSDSSSSGASGIVSRVDALFDSPATVFYEKIGNVSENLHS